MPFDTCQPECGMVHTDTCRIRRLIPEYDALKARLAAADDQIEDLKRAVARERKRADEMHNALSTGMAVEDRQ
jgi:hypothetical protein